MKWVPAVKFFKQVQSICCPVDFVLGKWKPSEIPMVKETLLKSVDAVECLASQGIGKAMTAFNK